MDKTGMVQFMAEELEVSNAQAERAFKAFLDGVKKGLVEDGKVSIVGFGSFNVRNRAARKGRNPQTGEEMQIPASKSVGFKAGKGLKDLVK